MSSLLAASAWKASAGLLAGGLAAVAVGLRWLQRFRRAAHGRSGRRSDVVSLTAQHALHVVELEGRRFLVSTGPAASPLLVAELTKERLSGEPV